MDSIDRETFPVGRGLSLLVFGDNADEIELAALDGARPFFGDDVYLTVAQGYIAAEVGGSLVAKAGGKKYHARVMVYAPE